MSESRSWAEMTSVHPVRDRDFNKCCMAADRFDGVMRKYYSRKKGPQPKLEAFRLCFCAEGAFG
jgi:hypothetical protein